MIKYDLHYLGLLKPFFDNPYFNIPFFIPTGKYIIDQIDINFPALIKIQNQKLGQTLIDINNCLEIEIWQLNGDPIEEIEFILRYQPMAQIINKLYHIL